ncbi:putative immunoglobulin-blocking virulence protein [Mycoplasma bradburyae]|uniref:putative immunoglobulin-blocking virulence protein n=1 Tax=Mycoplasma bradburyae TaxID=2963128 RepID=UPI0020CD3060|nr:putative immunoglobulin-blocking virulence protein [Mycoplasma bradburyae]UTS70838.1 putative immunoglobulin-blocking virulence protein [Mycoplasma bradburyae]
MLNSKKRKLIKLAAISSTAVIISASSTLGIVYSTSKVESKSNLIKRSNEIDLTSDATGTDDSYNSNRDFNLEKKPEKPDNRPVSDKPLPKDTPPEEETNNSFGELADDTPINFVTYDKQDYGLDENTPKQPNDPNKQVISDAEAKILADKARTTLATAKKAVLDAIKNGNSTAARDAFYTASGFSGNKDFFDIRWDKLFREYTNNGQKRRYIDDLLDQINAFSDEASIESESKANRIWKIQFNTEGINLSGGYRNEDDNPSIRYYKEVNKYRVLGNPNKWATDNSRDILSGHFDGWDMTIDTQKYINDKEYGINENDGIEVRHYTPSNKMDDYYKNKDDLSVFVLDVDNNGGYDKFINFIKKVYEKNPNKKIGVILKNVGKVHTTRNVYDIIKSLPNNVETLTVFLDGADTTSLLALEGRHLRELNIYTTGQVNTDLWGINPLAIKNINFIPSLLAYNVGNINKFEKGTTIASTPIFTTLKFDRNDDYKRVQEGIDIAKNRRSERIFQGNFQGDGAKPIFWDFADDPIIRNLKNLNVHDAELRFVRLSGEFVESDNRGNTYVVYNLDEFNHSQWNAAMQYKPEYEKKYISFGRGTEIKQPKTLILKGDESTLEKKSLEDLEAFVKYASNSKAFTEAYTTSKFIAQKIHEAVWSQLNDIDVKVVSKEKLEKFQIKKFNIDKALNPIGQPLKK